MPEKVLEKEKQPESSSLAIASLAVGVIGFLLSWTGLFGLPIAVVATVFGIVALFNKQDKNMAVAGLVLGVVAFVVSTIFTIVTLAMFFSTPINTTSELQPADHAHPTAIFSY